MEFSLEQMDELAAFPELTFEMPVGSFLPFQRKILRLTPRDYVAVYQSVCAAAAAEQSVA